MRIAVDIHGGDHAPEAIVEGVAAAARRWPDITFVLIGQNEKLLPHACGNIVFRLATEKIKTEEEPVKAVRQKKDSSIVVGCQMLREREVDAFISAGNTGALMAAGLFYTKRLPGVERPALAAVFPTTRTQGILVLDVGANPDAKPEHLYQYAHMGRVYAQKVLGFENPRVGLLNIGTEAGKGTERTKMAFALCHEDPSLSFIGNVEARDVLYAPCEVLVCDGFSGNILLKSVEGTARALFTQLKKECMKTLWTKLATLILRPGLYRLKETMDYKEYGGAPLLGLAGPMIKAHGSSDAQAILNAIRQARCFVEQDVIAHMEQGLSSVREEG